MLSRNEGSNITDSRFKKANVCFLLARVFKQFISKSSGYRIYIKVSFSTETSLIRHSIIFYNF